MGLKVTCAGIQSGSGRVRREIFKRAVSDQAVLNFCRGLDQYGVLYSIHLIGWNPYETIDDYERGLRLLLNLRTGVDLKIFRLQFFPGSDLTAIRDTLTPTGLQEEVHSYYAYLFSFIFNNKFN